MTSAKRDALVETIRRSPGPLSAAEIWERLRGDSVQVGIATVYRILKSETESGTLEPTEFPGGETRYGLAGQRHHHHFLCTECNRAFDAPGCADGIDTLAPPRFTVTSHAIMLFGRCEECQETS